MLRFLADGFTRGSAAALLLLVTTYSSIGYRYSNLIHPEYGMDWLLAGIWVVLSGLVIWGLQPRRDLLLLFVGLCGGAVIEWWGTNTELWRYFTDERPPVWILPAWPIAALSVDRLGRMVDRALPWIRRSAAAYWVVTPAFVAVMTRFLWPSIHEFASQVVVALMLGVTLLGARPGRDLVLFVAGAGAGIFLEYWGTTRQCWTYYTGESPPYEAVLAHGFASIAFARAVQIAEAILKRLRRGQPIPETS